MRDVIDGPLPDIAVRFSKFLADIWPHTALVIFTLAALVTAIATAHAQPLPFQQGSYQPAQPQPFQRAQLAPFVTTEGGQALAHAHAPTPVRP